MTKDGKLASFLQIKKFVDDNHLRNSKGNVLFNAEVVFNTASKSDVVYVSEISIGFTGYNVYGDLKILENNIDSRVFPTDFSANFQDYKIDGNGNLLITGFHEKNPKIGKYDVTIRFLDRDVNF